MIFGIDLGTTNSLIAYLDQGVPKVVPNALGRMLTPSVVSLDAGGELLIGQAARERLVTHPQQTVACFKRLMGSQHVTRLGSQAFRPEELSALILRRLKDDVQAALGEVVEEVVISVPAYFNDQQRKATRLAGQIAGLNVLRLLNEPTAAALFHGIQDRDSDAVYLVFDLGGGTFDVSILHRFSGIMEVRATGGDSFLGGDDFTHALVKLIADRADINETQRLVADIAAGLLHTAETVKRALTVAPETSVNLPPALGSSVITVTVVDFEKACAPLLARLRSPIERALRDSRLRASDLHEIVLVGGATRMPMVRRLASQLFGRLPSRHLDPDETVALGAAVCAGLIARDVAFEDMVLTDVCPHSLGTSVAESNGHGGYTPGIFMPIIERNTTIPASRVRKVFTLRDQQSALSVDVFQGESRMCENNVHLGELNMPIPLRKAGEVAANIRYTYDINGILDVDVDIEGEDIRHNLVIKKIAGEVSEDEIVRRRAELAALKIHPRVKEENRALVERAERMFQQRLGNEREYIGKLLLQFTAILDGQDPHQVQHARQQMGKALDALEGSVW